MINVLLVDTSLSGHHMSYLQGLMKIKNVRFCCLIPSSIDNSFPDGVNVYNNDFNTKEKPIIDYIKLMSQVKTLIKKEKIDVVHFLDGDSIMRFMGTGYLFLNIPKIITYHGYYSGIIRALSYRISSLGKTKIVVHTMEFKEKLVNKRIKNVDTIDYPAFNFDRLKCLNKQKCRDELDINTEKLLVSILGGTSEYKGFDVLFGALKGVSKEICFLIAGKECDVDYQTIRNHLSDSGVEFILRPGWLSDEDYLKYVVATDIILVPYKKFFDGASGPLVDGVCANKLVLSSNHGSIGKLVKSNHLGDTFESENSQDLCIKLNELVQKHTEFNLDTNYIQLLRPELFCDKYFEAYSDVIHS